MAGKLAISGPLSASIGALALVAATAGLVGSRHAACDRPSTPSDGIANGARALSHSIGPRHGVAQSSRDTGARRPPSGVAPVPETRFEAPSGVAAATRVALERALAERDPRLAPILAGGTGRLGARRGVSADVTARGARLRVGGDQVELRVAGIGRGAEGRVELGESAPIRNGHTLQIDRGTGTIEWWRALPQGLEHGVTISLRPVGGGEAVVTIATEGSLRPRLEGEGIVFVGDDDRPGLAYDELLVVDAAGRELPARFEIDDARVRIVFDDSRAVYPVVVDPLAYAQEQKIVASDRMIGDSFGAAVAMSGDGTRIVVGAHYVDGPAAETSVGSAYIFVRSGSTWTFEQELGASDWAAGDEFGTSVAISDDGTYVAVGSIGHTETVGVSSQCGAGYIFKRSATTWTQEAKLIATAAYNNMALGTSIALSADGSRAAVGAPLNFTPAFIFRRSGTTWTQEQAISVAGGTSTDGSGRTVALSDDGSRVVVSAHNDSTPVANAGTAFVYVRSVTTWTLEQELVASDRASGDHFGRSVAISGDGTRVAVAASDKTIGGSCTKCGAVYVYTRSVSTWTEEQRLIAADGAINDYFGWSVAMNTAGTRLAIGAYLDDDPTGTAATDNGAAYEFVRSGTWSFQQKLFSTGRLTDDRFGTSVAMNGDGFRIVVGADLVDGSGQTNAGAAYAFFATTKANGVACVASDADCYSGFCADGVCCDTACGNSVADDCQACAVALTGVASGTCTALSIGAAPGVTCRASAGGCDPAESCSPGVTTCPADTIQPNAFPCRVAAGPCDVPEACNGSSVACPSDALAGGGTMCRIKAGVCDGSTEFCTGSSAACPPDDLLTSECRAATDLCDRAEVCTGLAANCPSDLREAPGFTCRPAFGECDVPEVCSGGTCPADGFATTATVCRASVGACDAPEVCAGDTSACPADVAVADGTTCDDALTCTQSSACQLGVCAPSFMLDCSDSVACTTDICSEPNGCSHTSTAACGGDAGADAGSDASSGPDTDAGVDAPASGGCSCRVAGTRSAPRGPSRSSGWAFVGVALGLAFTRRTLRIERACRRARRSAA